MALPSFPQRRRPTPLLVALAVTAVLAAVTISAARSDARRRELYARESDAADHLTPTAGVRELDRLAVVELDRAFRADPADARRRYTAVRWRFAIAAGFEVGGCRSVFGDGVNVLFRHQAEVDALDPAEPARVEAKLAGWSDLTAEWVDAVVLNVGER